jgi:hypothetical protein
MNLNTSCIFIIAILTYNIYELTCKSVLPDNQKLLNANLFSDEESAIVVEALHELVRGGFLKYQEGYYYLKG